MATPNQDPEFYQNYTAAEIKKFESILRLIHSPQPNVELAKKMVTHFSDNNELARFKGFKKEFENAMQTAARNVSKHDKAQDNLKQRETELGVKNKELVHSQVHKVGEELGKRRVSDESTNQPSNKKHKR